MSKFAQGTDVPPEKTQMQIQKMLRDQGCQGVMMGYESDRAFIGFVNHSVQVRLFCPLVQRDSENRRRWRVMRIVLQSKFEVISCGIKTFEEEFFADIVMPDGRTVAQAALPAVTKAISSGVMPSSLLALPERAT